MHSPRPKSDYARIERVIRYLDQNFRDQPTLTDLAKVAGLSEFHFHRLFTRWAGTTPKSFLKSLTVEHAKQLLRESRDLLEVSLASGLSGPGRLHDLFVTVEGVSPGEYKKAGSSLEISYGISESPFGSCFIGLSHRGICYLSFIENIKDGLKELQETWPRANLKQDKESTRAMISKIFDHTRQDALRVILSGTPFQLRVWKALLAIPPGQVLSYGDLATRLGHPKAARAVGSAVGANSIAYLIPCHRVIRETGIIGEYRWGPCRKRAILGWESARNIDSSITHHL